MAAAYVNHAAWVIIKGFCECFDTFLISENHTAAVLGEVYWLFAATFGKTHRGVFVIQMMNTVLF